MGNLNFKKIQQNVLSQSSFQTRLRINGNFTPSQICTYQYYITLNYELQG